MEKKNENGACISAVHCPGSGTVAVTVSGPRAQVRDAFVVLVFELLHKNSLSYEEMRAALTTALVSSIYIQNR